MSLFLPAPADCAKEIHGDCIHRTTLSQTEKINAMNAVPPQFVGGDVSDFVSPIRFGGSFKL